MPEEGIMEEEWKSRSQKKREDRDVQAMGLKLASLEEKDWKELPLSEELLEALKAYPAIRGHGARLRHEKRIGKLMREEEAENREAISAFLNRMEGKKEESRNRHQQMESLRDRLGAGDEKLLERLLKLPSLERDQLLFLTDQARKEVRTGKTEGAKKALFRYLEKRLPDDF